MTLPTPCLRRPCPAWLLGLAAALPLALPSCAQSSRAERLLAKLSNREKAGQLMVVWTRSDAVGADRQKLLDGIRAADLGGVIFSLGSAESAAALVDRVQNGLKIPLLCAGDFEAGVGFRLTGSTDFGNNMLIGATGSTLLAARVGKATADEARALGFHWNFAPSVDVNSNPANPIINVRSFGEDPQKVGRFAAAFIAGSESAGVLTTAKHFPGHGDVASDSHLTMPTVPGSRERLERVELPPFQAAIQAGVASVMTGHLAVPGLGEDPSIPATLSSKILTDLLRGTLGFDGIIVTDAMDMGGVREKIQPIDGCLRALRAGVDVLLMPPDPVAVRDAIVAAVQSGDLEQAVLDRAALRVLRAKERVGLLDGRRTIPARTWEETVASAEHTALADEVAQRGLTLVRDRDGLVPLPKVTQPVCIVLADKDDEAGKILLQSLEARGFAGHRLHPESSVSAISAAQQAVMDAGFVVSAFAIKVRSYSGRIGVPTALQPVLDALRTKPGSVAISLGNPYLVRDLPDVSTYLCAFAATPHTERAVAAALAGEAPITGRMPVHLPGASAVGAGSSSWPAGAMERAEPSTQGLHDGLARQIRSLLYTAVRDGAFPGAAVCVTRRGKIVAEVAAGRATYEDDAPIITPDVPYDLASLTKVCATTPAVLRLVARGELSLDQKVTSLVPAFAGGDKDDVTIRHLLTHSAGLPAYIRFFKTIEGKETIVDAAAKAELSTKPGSAYKYSDLGLILLMACVEAATGEDFATVCQREVFDPLGMTTARFVPRGAEPYTAAPPTEDDGFRGRIVHGEVHDENAWAMGGVSGHAGLFANAIDVARIGNAYLSGGHGGTFLPRPLAAKAIRRANVVSGSSRGLGWDTFQEGGGSHGTKLSDAAFGHTGFTGTSIWCDPATDLCIVLLTNRVHPTRDNKKLFKVRGALADLVVDAIVD